MWESAFCGKAHFVGKLEGFGSGLVLVGFSADEANTKQKGKPLVWQVFGLGAAGGTFSHVGFGGSPKHWVGFLGQTLLPTHIREKLRDYP